MRGNVTRRGRNSWRLKFDLQSTDGKRQTRYVTLRGCSRKDAERELNRLIGTAHAGTYVEANETTITAYLRNWLDNAHSLAASTLRRYRDLAEAQIIPHLGQVPLQKLKPAHVENWHGILLTRGGKDGAPLAARTCGHAHKVLHLALARAVKAEVIARNVAAVMKPPKVDESEVQILRADQIGIVTAALDGHWLKPMVILALATGMRRGEILALAWGAVDLDKASIRIERSLEQTKAGLAFKSPKTKTSKRMVSLPPTAVEVLREHRRQQLETRLQLGQGKPTLVFSNIEGEAIPPMNFSRDFARFVKARQLPAVTFHALRHTHVSALISAGVDVLTISRRIGHANAAITLKTYSHLFAQNDSAAVDAIEAALRGKP
jgi:integrase